MENNRYIVYADRDELQQIVIASKITYGGAIVAASDAIEVWDRVTIYKGDTRLAELFPDKTND